MTPEYKGKVAGLLVLAALYGAAFAALRAWGPSDPFGQGVVAGWLAFTFWGECVKVWDAWLTRRKALTAPPVTVRIAPLPFWWHESKVPNCPPTWVCVKANGEPAGCVSYIDDLPSWRETLVLHIFTSPTSAWATYVDSRTDMQTDLRYAMRLLEGLALRGAP